MYPLNWLFLPLIFISFFMLFLALIFSLKCSYPETNKTTLSHLKNNWLW